MRPPLTIAAVQPPTVARDVGANALTHATAVRTTAARVVVFPEMSLTGYELDAPPIDPDDDRLAPIVNICAATGAIALVGAPVAGEGDGRSIGVLAIDGQGSRIAYRKMHLGGTEPDHFTPGTRPEVIEVDGWRLGLAICRDTGLAQHAAETAARGIDAYVAGVLESADDLAVPEQRARRIAAAHGVWVVMASFAGSTGGGYDAAAGCSGIWAPDGSEAARAGPEPGAFARATLG